MTNLELKLFDKFNLQGLKDYVASGGYDVYLTSYPIIDFVKEGVVVINPDKSVELLGSDSSIALPQNVMDYLNNYQTKLDNKLDPNNVIGSKSVVDNINWLIAKQNTNKKLMIFTVTDLTSVVELDHLLYSGIILNGVALDGKIRNVSIKIKNGKFDEEATYDVVSNMDDVNVTIGTSDPIINNIRINSGTILSYWWDRVQSVFKHTISRKLISKNGGIKVELDENGTQILKGAGIIYIDTNSFLIPNYGSKYVTTEEYFKNMSKEQFLNLKGSIICDRRGHIALIRSAHIDDSGMWLEVHCISMPFDISGACGQIVLNKKPGGLTKIPAATAKAILRCADDDLGNTYYQSDRGSLIYDSNGTIAVLMYLSIPTSSYPIKMAMGNSEFHGTDCVAITISSNDINSPITLKSNVLFNDEIGGYVNATDANDESNMNLIRYDSVGNLAILVKEGGVLKYKTISTASPKTADHALYLGQVQNNKIPEVTGATVLPKTVATATTMFGRTPAVSDWVRIYHDEEAAKSLSMESGTYPTTERPIQSIDASGNITWGNFWIINPADYQAQTGSNKLGMIPLASNVAGQWSGYIDSDEFVRKHGDNPLSTNQLYSQQVINEGIIVHDADKMSRDDGTGLYYYLDATLNIDKTKPVIDENGKHLSIDDKFVKVLARIPKINNGYGSDGIVISVYFDHTSYANKTSYDEFLIVNGKIYNKIEGGTRCEVIENDTEWIILSEKTSRSRVLFNPKNININVSNRYEKIYNYNTYAVTPYTTYWDTSERTMSWINDAEDRCVHKHDEIQKTVERDWTWLCRIYPTIGAEKNPYNSLTNFTANQDVECSVKLSVNYKSNYSTSDNKIGEIDNSDPELVGAQTDGLHSDNEYPYFSTPSLEELIFDGNTITSTFRDDCAFMISREKIIEWTGSDTNGNIGDKRTVSFHYDVYYRTDNPQCRHIRAKILNVTNATVRFEDYDNDVIYDNFDVVISEFNNLRKPISNKTINRYNLIKSDLAKCFWRQEFEGSTVTSDICTNVILNSSGEIFRIGNELNEITTVPPMTETEAEMFWNVDDYIRSKFPTYDPDTMTWCEKVTWWDEDGRILKDEYGNDYYIVTSYNIYQNSSLMDYDMWWENGNHVMKLYNKCDAIFKFDFVDGVYNISYIKAVMCNYNGGCGNYFTPDVVCIKKINDYDYLFLWKDENGEEYVGNLYVDESHFMYSYHKKNPSVADIVNEQLNGIYNQMSYLSNDISYLRNELREPKVDNTIYNYETFPIRSGERILLNSNNFNSAAGLSFFAPISFKHPFVPFASNTGIRILGIEIDANIEKIQLYKSSNDIVYNAIDAPSTKGKYAMFNQNNNMHIFVFDTPVDIIHDYVYGKYNTLGLAFKLTSAVNWSVLVSRGDGVTKVSSPLTPTNSITAPNPNFSQTITEYDPYKDNDLLPHIRLYYQLI